MKKTKLFFVFSFLLAGLFMFSLVADACSCVLVGKDASVDGSVLIGHNEDNGGRILMAHYVVPRINHEPFEVVRFENGGTTPQVPVTWSYTWSQTAESSFSDAFLNEWGVFITSNSCAPSREDIYTTLVTRGDVTDGGIGHGIRQIMAERAKTAREAVEIAAALVDEFGYIASGRSYQVADSNEAWLLHIVAGKHYVAERVPDDKVVFIPNVYVIREIDVNDKENFIVSPGLVEYAIERGWYDPKSGKEFDFAAAYQAPASGKALTRGYDTRQWYAHKMITGVEPPTPSGAPLPFAVTPKNKMGIEDVNAILGSHYEDTVYDKTLGYTTVNSPHWTDERVICTATSQESVVVQLRSNVPAPIGVIMWKTTGRPDTSPLIPWYIGIESVPKANHFADPIVGKTFQFRPSETLYDYDLTKSWWIFNTLQALVDVQYREQIEFVSGVMKSFQAKLISEQPVVDSIVESLYKTDPESARKFVTWYTESLTNKANDIAKELIEKIRTLGFDIKESYIRKTMTSGDLNIVVYGSDNFNVKDIAIVKVGPAYRNPSGWVAAANIEYIDINNDGKEDCIATISIVNLLKLISKACYTDIYLSVQTSDGRLFAGYDLLNILP